MESTLYLSRFGHCQLHNQKYTDTIEIYLLHAQPFEYLYIVLKGGEIF